VRKVFAIFVEFSTVRSCSTNSSSSSEIFMHRSVCRGPGSLFSINSVNTKKFDFELLFLLRLLLQCAHWFHMCLYLSTLVFYQNVRAHTSGVCVCVCGWVGVCVARLRGTTSARRAVLRIKFMRIKFFSLVRVLHETESQRGKTRPNSKGKKRAQTRKGKNAPKFERGKTRPNSSRAS